MAETTKRGTPRLPDAVRQYATKLGKAGLDYRAIRIARTEQASMLADEQTEIAENSDICSGEMDFVMDRGRDHWNCNCEKYAEQNPWKVDDPDRPQIPVHPNCMCEWRPRLKTDEEIIAAFKEEMAQDLETIEGTQEQADWLERIDKQVESDDQLKHAVISEQIEPIGKPTGKISFTELSDYVKEKINVPFSDGLKDYDTDAMMEVAKSVENTLNEYSELKKHLTGFEKTDMEEVYMECGYNGKIYFGKLYKSLLDVNSQLNKDVAKGTYQEDIGIGDFGEHELLHLVEKALINKNNSYVTDDQKLNAWKKCTEADDILWEALEELNAKQGKKYTTWQDVASEISGNATKSPSEGLVETLFDYNHHKENPRLFSEIVYNITNRRLR
jgi:hypothetical protein